MSISMYAATVPVFKQFLDSLSNVLAKGQAYAAEKKVDEVVLLQSRLALDMYPLTRQVQIVSDFAKNVSGRLAGVEVPSFPDTETTLVELQERIAKTLAFIQTLKPEQFVGSEERNITIRPGTPREQTFNGLHYLLSFGLPNFYFHHSTAYNILRHHGVPVGKGDFLGNYQ